MSQRVVGATHRLLEHRRALQHSAPAGLEGLSEAEATDEE